MQNNDRPSILLTQAANFFIIYLTRNYKRREACSGHGS